MSKTAAIFFNTSNATTKDLDNGRATFRLQTPLRFPKESKKHPEISMFQFSFNNFFTNISAELKNNTIYYSDDTGNDEKYSVVIPDGSYDITTLNNFVAAYQKENTGTLVFSLLPNYPSNSTYVEFAPGIIGYYIWMKTDVSPYSVLGWNADQYIPASKSNVANDVEFAPNISLFNSITVIKIRTNLCSESIDDDNRSNLLYKSIPVSPVGSVQRDQPPNLLWMNSNALVGSFNVVRFQLQDQNNNDLKMSEDFDITIQIKTF